jgi:peptidoglycan/xylan/chitin deacetylase (PgdA/CDA1 family)
LLRERGIPAVAFVCPGLVGTNQPFWWTEVETLYAAGARVAQAPARASGSAAGLVGWLKIVPDARRREAVAELRQAAPWVLVTAPQLAAADVRALHAAGVEVGNHTWSHPCLDRCADGEPERQVDRAHDRLTEVLGVAPRAFAYPNGNHDPRVEAVLARLGYAAGFLFDHRLAQVSGPGTHPLRLSRLRVSTTTSDDRFALILSGLHAGLHRLRGGV